MKRFLSNFTPLLSAVAPITCCYVCCCVYSSSNFAVSAVGSEEPSSRTTTFKEYFEQQQRNPSQNKIFFFKSSNDESKQQQQKLSLLSQEESKSAKMLKSQNFVFAGYHGAAIDFEGKNTMNNLCTSLTAATSDQEEIFQLSSKPKQEEKPSDDNKNWSELGKNGIYISTEIDAALLYGGAQASLLDEKEEKHDSIPTKRVAIFEVYYDSSEQWNAPPTVIPSEKTFEKFTSEDSKTYENPPHDVLVVQNDGNNFAHHSSPEKSSPLDALEQTQGKMALNSLLPSQYKINSHKLPHLRFVLKVVTESAQDAFVAADEMANLKNGNKSNKMMTQPLPIVKVMPDGNCMFHSLSWHLKMNPLERGEFQKKKFEGKSSSFQLFDAMTRATKNHSISSFYGFDPHQMRKTMELKKELVDWMIQKHQEEKDSGKTTLSTPNSQESPTLEETWNLITVFGEETAFFGGAQSLDSYLGLLKRECDLYFSIPFEDYVSGKKRSRGTGIFADIQLFYPAIAALYPKTPVIVFTDREIAQDENVSDLSKLMKPLIFVNNKDSNVAAKKIRENHHYYPVEMVFTWGSLHYDAVGWRGKFSTSKL